MNKNRHYSPLGMFICSHKPFRPLPQAESRPDMYKIITNCDDPFPSTRLDLLRVNKMECEYGSEQNLCLNEWRMINALYYYKKLPEYIGICHYNRYYDPDDIEECKKRLSNANSGCKIGIGVPFKYAIFQGEERATEKFYGYWHNIDDFNALKAVIQELHPNDMYAFEEMANADYLLASALMILRKEDFYDLCEFNFEVYDALMERYGFKNDQDAMDYVTNHKDAYIKPNTDFYQDLEKSSRIIGYLLERSTNVWLRIKRENGKSLLEESYFLKWTAPQRG